VCAALDDGKGKGGGPAAKVSTKAGYLNTPMGGKGALGRGGEKMTHKV